MKIDRKQITAALRVLAPLTRHRHTMPVLSHVRLTSTGSRLQVQATDLETVATVHLRAVDGYDAPFDVVLPAKSLTAAAKGAGALEIDGTRVGAGTLASLPVEDWPAVAARCEFADHAATQWLEAVGVVEHAMSTDETRCHLNGVYLDPRGYAVATDGHRLARAASGVVFGDDPTAGVILPRVAVDVMLAAAKRATVATVRIGACGDTRTDGHGIARARGKVTLRVERGDGLAIEVTSLGIDGDFPEYDRVIPRLDGDGWESLHAATVLDSAAVTAALADLAPYRGDKRVLQVAAKLNGALELRSIHPDVGEGMVTVPTPSECPDVEFGVNGDYLRDAMTLGERVEFRVRCGTEPLVFRCGERLAVVMPMRV